MANGIASIEVKAKRGKITVIGMGQSVKGQKYIKDQKELTVHKTSDPKFKGELRTAVTEIFG